ncbi:MAG: UDP-N-acetylmuramoyl-tripeptide--D-alanyl-D-alanine ligase [Myxococcales bacterium]|nr:UDP-N-acetylmuramoyl-tripeptide--D-alanyl-D-alanine ligase [Myxococcales bacterium]
MSEAFQAADAVAWTGGILLRGASQATLRGVCIDTRSLEAGALFVAIVGPRHDAHDYLDRAVAAGAAGLVIARGRSAPRGVPAALPLIAVEDTTRALGALAAGHRKRYTGPLVAITGSNGKTTTKEMCAAILSVAAPCLKNEGNLNNEFGLPLTLLRRDASHRSVVVELGMNHRGEIARLAAIARPNVGVITNVGTAHIEYLGSREAIAQEKGDLLAQLDETGVAVLNADDALARGQAQRTRARALRFGHCAEADVRAEHVRALDGRGFGFALCAPEGRVHVEVAGLGETAVTNALAASAAALAAGAPLADVPVGLARYRPMAGRLEPLPLAGGGVLINDSYNANPQSLEVALRILAAPEGAEAGGVAQRIAVIGDMGELGESGPEAHREAGRLAARLGIDHLFALGARAEQVAEGARDEGMAADRVHAGRDWREIAEQVRARLTGGDRVLIKGSRAMRMERIVSRLVAARDSAEDRGCAALYERSEV